METSTIVLIILLSIALLVWIVSFFEKMNTIEPIYYSFKCYYICGTHYNPTYNVKGEPK